ncbi:hypothetical protein G7Z17_g1508 [Cylindrodendrum hubeiense]|uniref:Cytochrome P450 n=1 Tax=Cylindrodendrum hubeiense TaxID=595255 RepID=A0A9P5HKN3_9HYPO|nr:hypothetical protein G7Z17_g1508 [Cylindrodendrum hubeiense]
MVSNNTFSEWWPGFASIPHIDKTHNVSPLHLIISIFAAKHVVIVVIGLFFVDIVYNIFFHPLRHIPGPFLAKFSHAWRNHRYFRGSWHDDTLELHHRYGNVVRIAPGEVSFVDEHGLKSLYGHGKQVLKTKWYDSWIVPNMTVSFFAATDVRVHRHLRSRVSGAYSMTSILAMEPLIQDVMDLNITKLGEFADRGEVVPMDKWANYFTFDTVGKLAMGGTIGFLEHGKDVDGIIRSIHDGFYLMANMGNVPFQMFWFNNPLAKWALRTFGGQRLNAFDIFLEWLDERVEERMTQGLKDGQRRDMLQHYIEAKDPQGLPVKKGDVMIEGVNILGAGADTTTIGILAILGSVLTNPNAKRKLQEEIDQAYDDLSLDQEHRQITFKEAELWDG